ncbi:MAG: NF038129 family PEP-CTERM protein [Acidobacteriia bacterium]|nr:NF038129 family PEP-CTERM protein [Terriglobia bacterium]
MRFRFAILILALASVASANVAILRYAYLDTSLISGETGAVEFQFNQGLNGSQAATVEILDFAYHGALLAHDPDIGGVAPGSLLPGTVTIDNSDPLLNSYYHNFQFGNWISFWMRFSGPAISSPDPSFTSGSAFALILWSGGEQQLTTDTSGNLFTMDINLDGTASVNDFSENGVASFETPEPGGLALLGAPLLGLWLWRRRSVRLSEPRP